MMELQGCCTRAALGCFAVGVGWLAGFYLNSRLKKNSMCSLAPPAQSSSEAEVCILKLIVISHAAEKKVEKSDCVTALRKHVSWLGLFGAFLFLVWLRIW